MAERRERRITIEDGEHRYSYDESNPLDKGSCGSVYKAMDESSDKINKTVAIKIYKKINKKKEFYDREVNVLKKLKDHDYPYILKMYSCFEDEENWYLVSHFCEEGTLKNVLKRNNGTLYYEEALKYLYQLARGIEDLHYEGLVHLDITLANVLISNGICKLGDFGSAVRAQDFVPKYRAAPSYKAPEVKGYMSICVCTTCCNSFRWKIDVWSLGVIFFKLLFGKDTYQEYEKQILERKTRRERFPPHEHIPEGVIELLDGMLKVDHRERYDIKSVLRHEVFCHRTKEPMDSVAQKMNLECPVLL